MMTVARCTIAAKQARRRKSRAAIGSWATPGRDCRHRHLAAGLRRNTDGGIVKTQHQLIAFDAAGRQPIAGICARRHDNFETSVGAPNDLLACESVAIDRIGDEIRRRYYKASVSRSARPGVMPDRTTSQRPSRTLPLSSGCTVNDTPSPSAVGNRPCAGDRRPGIRVRVRRSGFRPGCPTLYRQPAKGSAAAERKISHAEADNCCDGEGKQRSDKQPHDRSADGGEIDSVGRLRLPLARRPISCDCRTRALPTTQQERRL